MLRRRGRSGERLLKERHADALRAADLFQSGRRPRLALDHFGKQRQPHGDDLALLGQAGDRLIEEGVLLLARLRRRAKRPNALPNAASTLRAWRGSKRSTSRRVLPFDEREFPALHEPAHGQPKIVPHHDDGTVPARRRNAAGPATSSVSSSFRLACSHCSNWSRTMSTFLPGLATRALPQRRQRLRTGRGRSASPGTCAAASRVEQASFGVVVRSPRCKRLSPNSPRRGSSPALTSDDLPQPDGP